METVLFALDRIEQEIGFGIWAIKSFSIVPSIMLFLGSAALFILGSLQLKKNLIRLRGWDLDSAVDYTRTARRFGGYYKIAVLLVFQTLWLYSLIISFISVLTADPF